MTYFEYQKLNENQKEAFHKRFYDLRDKSHNLELENFLNSKDVLSKLDLDINSDFGYRNPLDFELEWIESSIDVNNSFSHRISLTYLFKNNFTYAIVNHKSQLYQYLLNTNEFGKHDVLRSPETNICEYNNKDLVVFCENKHLFCYTGCSFSTKDNVSKDYFRFLGRIFY